MRRFGDRPRLASSPPRAVIPVPRHGNPCPLRTDRPLRLDPRRDTRRSPCPRPASSPPRAVIPVPRHGNPCPLRTDRPQRLDLATPPAAPTAPVRASSPVGEDEVGQPRALGPRGDPRCDIRPSPERLPTPTMPVEACPEPVEGAPRPGALARRAAARFTSKCRKMSQNVALFQPSTRKPLQSTSEKPHVLGPFPAILAHFRSIPAFGSHA